MAWWWDPVITDTLMLHPTTRRTVGAGIRIRGAIPVPLSDLRTARCHNLLKLASFLDGPLQSSRTVTQKRAVELQGSRNLRLIPLARSLPSHFLGEMLRGP